MSFDSNLLFGSCFLISFSKKLHSRISLRIFYKKPLWFKLRMLIIVLSLSYASMRVSCYFIKIVRYHWNYQVFQNLSLNTKQTKYEFSKSLNQNMTVGICPNHITFFWKMSAVICYYFLHITSFLNFL